MRRPFLLGLTGSIGMGKSTTAQMFRDEGVPVWDADATVHRLYSPGQRAALAIAARYPQAMDADGGVDRAKLRAIIAEDASVMDWLNATIHPMTAEDRARFIADHSASDVLVLDIPLLFETGADAHCDAVLVVTAPPDVQRARVLARGMSEAEFDMILGRQISDTDKRARATYVIETLTEESARAAVRTHLQKIRADSA